MTNGLHTRRHFCLTELASNTAAYSAAHIHQITEYQAIPDGSGSFAVQITFPSGHSRLQRDFRTEAEAKCWIETQVERDAMRYRDVPSPAQEQPLP